MNEYIADVPFTAFREISNESSISISEKDIISEKTKFVFKAENEGYSLQINFVLDTNNISKSTIKELSSSKYPTEINNFKYNGFQGRLSINDISFPESADNKRLIEGTISGLLLPWPKHYPEKLSTKERKISIYGYGSYGRDFYAYDVGGKDYGVEIYGGGFYGE